MSLRLSQNNKMSVTYLKTKFQKGVKELLCQTLTSPQTMNDMIKGTLKIPE